MHTTFTPIVLLHTFAALAAVVLGAGMFLARKGTFSHRVAGRGWVALMLMTAISSFWIRSSGSFSWIHLLSAWTLLSLACAVYYVRRGNVRAHRRFMVGTFLGLAGAGLGALAPGRTLHLFFFA